MANFAPLEDYLGLNALVQRLKISTSEDEHWIQPGSCLIQHPAPALPKSPVDGPKLEDFDIIRMSRVYTERLSNNARRRRRPLSHCVFCKNNMESPTVYESHKLKEASGKITCPILRAYTCPICGASGDHAHTIKYCPLNIVHRMKPRLQ